MNDRHTRFAVLVRFVAWGDKLQVEELAAAMKLEKDSFSTKRTRDKFEPESTLAETAKTAFISVKFGVDDNQFDPDAQFEIAAEKLGALD